MRLKGWVELDGRRLGAGELEDLLESDPSVLTRLGGEFLLEWRGCIARDCMGIVPGPVSPGTIVCADGSRHRLSPEVRELSLGDALREAVRLRRAYGLVALSGGVDSALIAALAEVPALVVGMQGCRDHLAAERVAEALHLELEVITIREDEVKEALRDVISDVPDCTPEYAGIGAALHFIARGARDRGYTGVLTGQGADELFAGYARHLRSEHLREDLSRDLARLREQIVRDQAIAGRFGVLFSMPYLDMRVVKAAGSLPADGMIQAGIRKIPLRRLAEPVLGREIAWREKRAMQYGSGISACIRRIARKEGFRNVSGLIGLMKGELTG